MMEEITRLSAALAERMRELRADQKRSQTRIARRLKPLTSTLML